MSALPLSSPAGSPRTVLLVDDSDSFRGVTRLVLERNGYRVLEAADGQKACDLLQRTDRVACIVSDLNMPGMDGFAFLDRVRAGKHRFTPVIMLTTSTNDQHRETGRSKGANAWMSKPFKPGQLVDALNKLCA